jgi:hypothetical protein
MGDVALREEGEREGSRIFTSRDDGAKEWSLKVSRRTPSLALLDHAGECAGPAGLAVASPP